MMARSKCSNQRPDTLMQDRSPPARRNHLQRTAGPYKGQSRLDSLAMPIPLLHRSTDINRPTQLVQLLPTRHESLETLEHRARAPAVVDAAQSSTDSIKV